MAEPSSASEMAQPVDGDVKNHNGTLSASVSSPGGGKRSATEAFEKDSVEDLKHSETTLDDVLVSPVAKKSKLLDEELPDVDDNEEFPQQEEDLDAELALGLDEGEKEDLNLENGDLNMEEDDLDMGPEDLNMEQEQKQEGEEDSEPPTSQNNEIDIVDVDSDEEEEVEEFQGFQEEEDDDEEQETARAISRAQNQREARMLLQQLDDSARSKLCLTALEKYGEELFYGHEDARDAILVDACAQDSVLSLMRDAIRVRDLYMRGSAAAPVELDDDSDSDEETGGYEDDTEGGEEDKTGDSNDDEIVVISEEEQGEDESDNEESKRQDNEERQQSASDENDGDDESKEEEDAALGDVGEGVASGSPVAT
eukprot:jgi/Phyca11/550201/estExt2_Genewise1Plus.C_PHYCAscaffold_360121